MIDYVIYCCRVFFQFIFTGELLTYKRYYEQIDGKTADITKEIPFDLPDGWAWCRLRNIVMGFQYGTSEKSSPEGEVAVLRMGNLRDGEIIYNNLVFTSNAADISQYQLFAGDLLFNRTNSAEHVGKTSIYRGNHEAIFAGYLVRFHPILCSSDFINYVMNSSYHRNFCQSVKSDAVNQSNISAQKLSRFLFPLPPLAEQKRIVAQIESLLKCVDEIDLESETLENSITLAKQKILDLAIRGKLVPQDPADEPASELLKKIKVEKEALIKAGKLKRDKHESFIFRGDDNCYYEQLDGKTVEITAEIPFKIPESWRWCRLGSFAKIVMGQSPEGAFVKNEGPGMEFHQGKIFFGEKYLRLSPQRTTAPTRIAPAGSVLICVRAPVGVVNITAREICIGRGLAAAVAFCNITASFLGSWITARQRALVEKATGSTFLAVSVDQVNNLLVPIPPQHEQTRILGAISQFESILKSLQG